MLVTTVQLLLFSSVILLTILGTGHWGLRIRRFNCPNNFQTGMRKHDLGPRIF